jgi:hypothetical protein
MFSQNNQKEITNFDLIGMNPYNKKTPSKLPRVLISIAIEFLNGLTLNLTFLNYNNLNIGSTSIKHIAQGVRYV